MSTASAFASLLETDPALYDVQTSAAAPAGKHPQLFMANGSGQITVIYTRGSSGTRWCKARWSR